MTPPAVTQTARSEAQVLGQVIEAARMLGLDLSRQNTGAGVNPEGKAVRFGKPGNADLTGMLPDGRKLDCEVKREGFDPSKLCGAKKAHFDRQLARLRLTNDQGGVGFWTDSVDLFLQAVRWCLDGGLVEEPGYDKLVLVPDPRSRGPPRRGTSDR